jgi:ATP-dependent Lon protease
MQNENQKYFTDTTSIKSEQVNNQVASVPSHYDLSMVLLSNLVNLKEEVTKPVLSDFCSNLLARVFIPLNTEQQEYLYSLLTTDKRSHVKIKIKRLEYKYFGYLNKTSEIKSEEKCKLEKKRIDDITYQRSGRVLNKILSLCEISESKPSKGIDNNIIKPEKVITKKVFNLYDLEAELMFRCNENGVELVQEVLNKGNEKRVIITTKEMLVAFEKMYLLFPNFQDVISEIHACLKLSLYTELPIEFPVINLNGPPGIGKTHFIKTLCKLLNLDFHDASIATMSGKQDLIGGSSQFKNSTIGEIAKALLMKTDTYQPCILLDELCLAKCEGEHSIVPSLLALFDYEQRKCVKERYLDLDMDCSGILFFTTTNNIENLLPAVRSRLTNFEILPPSSDEMLVVCNEIYKSFLAEKGLRKLFIDNLCISVSSLLKDMTPREAKSAIISGVKRSLVRSNNKNSRINVLPDDVSHKLKFRNALKTSIGFIH